MKKITFSTSFFPSLALISLIALLFLLFYMNSRFRSYVKEIRKLEETKETLIKNNKQLSRTNKEFIEDNKELIEDNKELREDNKELREEVEKTIEQLSDEIKEKFDQITDIKESKEKLIKDNKKLIEINKNLEQERNRIKLDIEESKEKLIKDNKKLIEINKNLEQILADRQNIKDELKSLQIKLEKTSKILSTTVTAYPRPACGDPKPEDILPRGAEINLKWYPVYVEKHRLSEIREHFCSDAIPIRDKIIVASFWDKIRAENFARWIVGKVGEPVSLSHLGEN